LTRRPVTLQRSGFRTVRAFALAASETIFAVKFVLFDDAGKFHAGRVMSATDSSMQVELESGRRVKVKAANVLLRFDRPEPAELIAQGRALAGEIDLDLAWEFAPDGEFGFAELAREYFDANAGAEQQAAALFRLFEAPHYFRRVGKGLFKKAPAESVRAALAAIERKAQVAAQIEAWAAELIEGRCPPSVGAQLYKILFKPDKTAPEYKAVVEAARSAQRAPLDLLKDAGAIGSPYQFHWRRFLFENFPKGIAFAPFEPPRICEDLPVAPAPAFSIDDSATTEIDDAISVQGLGSGTVVLGIHIAAPGLAIGPDSAVDRLARERWSTVYMPGWKITMLPDAVVQEYTLAEGRDCPAVSLYIALDESTLELQSHETRLERIRVAANLRHDRLDSVVTEATLTGAVPPDYPFARELAFAYRVSRHLKARRESVRGKPEAFTRPEYLFHLDRTGNAEPDGSEHVRITQRQRGTPLDLIVAETMILANSTWGGWLAELGVPALYRSQASLAPGIKVRMGTKPLPHAGIGVAQYAWATSPLRRYVDLVNQWQIIACARHGRTAALAAPFRPKDAVLYSVLSGFEAAYAAYIQFQNGMERYWTLRWLEQNGVTELDAAVLRDGLVRADSLPLVFRALGCDALPRGARVRVRVTGSDLLTLEVHGSLAVRLDDPATTADDATIDETEETESSAAPLALAINVQDAENGDVVAAAAAAR
jgi:exoribonuclease-2